MKHHPLAGVMKFHRGFPSRILKNKRTLLVCLPFTYAAEKARRYPVIYMHDGQNVFDSGTSFSGVEWGAYETAEALSKENPPLEAIIVGIYNKGAARISEYAPDRDEARGGGKGREYAEFLVKEVKPFIDARYRTLDGRDHTAVAGSSLGGLISLFLILEYPEVFSKAGVLSPSLHWAGHSLLPLAGKKADPEKMKLWLSMGTEEWGKSGKGKKNREPVLDSRKLRDILLAKGFKKKKNLIYLEDKGGRHDEATWARLLPDVFRFFLKAIAR